MWGICFSLVLLCVHVRKVAAAVSGQLAEMRPLLMPGGENEINDGNDGNEESLSGAMEMRTSQYRYCYATSGLAVDPIFFSLLRFFWCNCWYGDGAFRSAFTSSVYPFVLSSGISRPSRKTSSVKIDLIRAMVCSLSLNSVSSCEMFCIRPLRLVLKSSVSSEKLFLASRYFR